MITIIVATYKRPERLLLCLESIRSQLYPPDAVIVVDDGDDNPDVSRGLTLDMGYTWLPYPRTIIRGKEYRNETRNINETINIIPSGIIQVIQADHILAPDYIMWLSRTYRLGEVHIGLTHHTYRNWTTLDISTMKSTVHVPDGEARYERHLLQGRKTLVDFSAWDLLDGLNFAVSKSSWQPLDPFFYGHGHAEMEWGIRMMAAGHRFVLNPMLKLWHLDEEKEKNLDPEIQRQVRRSEKYIETKWGRNIWGSPIVTPPLSVPHE